MDENYLKRYTVILGGGSGVLFQPLDETKTYILSARHIFYKDVENDRGQKTNILTEKISFYFSYAQNDKKEIEIKIGENYFEHSDENIDAAILILNENLGLNQIFVDENCIAFNECLLCGYPNKINDNDNDKYSNHQINRKIDTTNNGYLRLETNFGNLNHEDIIGFSGGGILRLNNGVINIIGIQSSTITDYANGQIDIVPINKFIQIVEENNLSEMIPSFLKSFEFLKDKVFDISAGILDENISYTRKFLKDKTLEVINSDITPIFIKNLFKERLLINENSGVKLNDELIYVTWLEFLTLINIAKEIACSQNDLEGIFSMTRLLYKNTDDDWQSDNFLGDCLSSNYLGLNENGTVFIKTKSNPIAGNIAYYKLEKGSLVPRIDSFRKSHENGTLSVVNDVGRPIDDITDFIFDKYNFVHFEYLKKYMLIENSENFKTYKRSNEPELLIKLKEEYGKVFGI
ncbi:ABC-three component system protein [Chryseobacterium turcicum]|uniref:ABC-three component systems C-terminal domain-containing protein n=1 Tax=Chryseobacterium turcicum TaxID=2898076 RepID=A0A9Q3YWM2_9FLAO|nr:ABC-three component system protein [Chryseobacterium turcicum]MCD1118109.1 hypothetical protein [Chryseobacterium turcicum]